MSTPVTRMCLPARSAIEPIILSRPMRCRAPVARFAIAAAASLRAGGTGARTATRSCASPSRRPRPASIPVRSLRPLLGHVIEAIFEPLLTYDYLARPAKLVPLTAEALPEIADDGKTYTFKHQEGHLLRRRSGVQGQEARADRRTTTPIRSSGSSTRRSARRTRCSSKARSSGSTSSRRARRRPASSTTTRRSRASRRPTATRCVSGSSSPTSTSRTSSRSARRRGGARGDRSLRRRVGRRIRSAPGRSLKH